MRGGALALLTALVLVGCAGAPGDAAPSTPASPAATTATPASAATTPTASPPAEPTQCQSQHTATRAPHPTWLLSTSYGAIRVVLFCDQTPITAQNIVTLTERGFYDMTKFHRVVRGFVIQAGDPLSANDSASDRWGTGGPGYTIQDEFYCADGSVSHDYPAFCPSGLGLRHAAAGVASMANSGRPHTGGSQFFITAAPASALDGKHSVFGEVADQESLDVVLAINDAPTGRGPHREGPREPIVIERATIEWS